MSQQSPTPSPPTSVSPLQIMDVLLDVPQHARVSQLGTLRQVNHNFKKQVEKDSRLHQPDHTVFTEALLQDAPYVANHLYSKFTNRFARPGYHYVASRNPNTREWLTQRFPHNMNDDDFLDVHHKVFSPEQLKETLKDNPQLARQRAGDNYTLPIHLAVRYNIPDSSKLLLKADPSLIQETGRIDENNVFENLLLMAAYYGSADVARELLKHINPNVPNRWGETALHYAVDRGHPEMADLLLQKGANPDLPNQWGDLPLDFAFGPHQQEFRDIFARHSQKKS